MGSITNTPTAHPMLHEGDTHFTTIDQLIRRRASTHKNETLISYPIHETDFVDYTGEQLERITRFAAQKYLQALTQLGLGLGLGTPDKLNAEGYTNLPANLKVALVGISSLEYYVTFLALQRLGVTTLFISPRLADQGHCHLLNTTACHIAIASGPSYSTLERIRTGEGLLANDLRLIPMIDYDYIKLFLTNKDDTNNTTDLAPQNAGEEHGFIIHSGGTTGLPKPVPLKVSAWLLQAHRMIQGNPLARTLSTLPLFHSFGLATLLRGLVGGTRISLLNAARPITAAIIQESLDRTNSEALVTVPYTMKFLAEAEGGLQCLSQLKQVINAGSAIPEDLGNKVVAAGANISHFYGQTECGALMVPPQDRMMWSWVTPLPHAAPFLAFEREGGGDQNLYHLIVLAGLKQKVFSDRPDGSYATKDLFQRHPTDPNLWKFVARKDDIIVLVNGEKADPIPLEEAVMANPNVKVAVAFGAGHDSLGLIVIRSEKSSHLSYEQYLQTLVHDIELGNSRVPSYARLSTDFVIVKDADTQYPATDKSTVIRSLFLKSFEKDIEDCYLAKQSLKLQSLAAAFVSDSQVMDIVSNAVQEQLRQRSNGSAKDIVLADKFAEFSNTTDFFDLGLDSLQASNIRNHLLREVNLGGGSLAMNVVFDHPNVDLLTKHILGIRAGQLVASDEMKIDDLARAMVERYSQFDDIQPGTTNPKSTGENVVSDNFLPSYCSLKRDNVKVVTLVHILPLTTFLYSYSLELPAKLELISCLSFCKEMMLRRFCVS